MNKKHLFYIIGILFLGSVLTSCEKDIVMREKLSGPKTISLYQWKKMDAEGNFSEVIYDTTGLGDLILWDNASESINNVTYLGEEAPAGWYYANVGVNGTHNIPIGWYSDYETNSSFTFWSEDDLGGKYRVTYAMEIKGKTIHLETVYHTEDGVFSEVIEMEDLD
ncbi:MAG: hypothetical protein RL204_622 [Bacteroidota bacterium]|jgi:hypothetical protein